MARLGQQISEVLTWVVTWVGRVVALIGGFEQVVLHGSNPNAAALAFCGCLLAGVETFKLVALRAVDRIFDAFSGPEQRETPPPSSPATRKRASKGRS